jgi:hypothetical protein
VFNIYSIDTRNNNRGGINEIQQSSKFASTSLKKSEIENLLKDMKIDILHSLSMYADTMQIKGNQEEMKVFWLFSSLSERKQKKHSNN